VAEVTPHERELLLRAHTLLLWCDQHWRNHNYEGSPSVVFLSRVEALLRDIRATLKTTAPPDALEAD
jgi:hypothetical protein